MKVGGEVFTHEGVDGRAVPRGAVDGADDGGIELHVGQQGAGVAAGGSKLCCCQCCQEMGKRSIGWGESWKSFLELATLATPTTEASSRRGDGHGGCMPPVTFCDMAEGA